MAGICARFPRQARLTSSEDFERALRDPDFRIGSGPLRLNAVFNRMHSARLGLIIGKKAVSEAHDRNRLKRIVREHFRRARPGLGSVDIVVRLNGPITPGELHRRLDALFSDVAEKARERSVP